MSAAFRAAAAYSASLPRGASTRTALSTFSATDIFSRLCPGTPFGPTKCLRLNRNTGQDPAEIFQGRSHLYAFGRDSELTDGLLMIARSLFHHRNSFMNGAVGLEKAKR